MFEHDHARASIEWIWYLLGGVGNLFAFLIFPASCADGVLGAAIAGAGMVVVGGTVLAIAGAAALVGILTKKK